MTGLNRFRSSALAKNAAWMLAGQSGAVVAQGLYFIVLARVLGSAEYGLLVGATAMVSIFSNFTSLGSGMVLLRYVSTGRERFPEYWGNAIFSTLVTGLLVAGLVSLGAGALLHSTAPGMLAMIAIGDCVFARLADCGAQAFQAMERFRLTALLSALNSSLRLVVAATLWFLFGRTTAPVWAAASMCISGSAALVVTILVSVHLGAPKFQPRLFLSRIGEGFGFSIAYSTTAIYNDIDKAMLTRYGMYGANGAYSAAYRMIDLACIPIRSVHVAALPRFFQAGAVNPRGSAAFARHVLKRTFVYGLAAAVALFLAAPLVALVLGKAFAATVPALRWLCLIPVLRTLHLSAGDAITSAGHQRWRTSSQLGAAAFNFCVNLYFIPRWSWQGAAWSSLLTDGALAVANWGILTMLISRPEKPQPAAASAGAPAVKWSAEAVR